MLLINDQCTEMMHGDDDDGDDDTYDAYDELWW